MSRPFQVPGVSLEEVLGACKTERGRELYALMAAAAVDLLDHVRERREDGDLVLVELPAPPAEQARGDSAPSSASPLPAPTARPGVEELLTDVGRRALELLRRDPSRWWAPRELAAELEVANDRLTRDLRDLRLAGLAESNGRLRTAARVRAYVDDRPKPRSEVELEPPPHEPADPGGDAEQLEHVEDVGLMARASESPVHAAAQAVADAPPIDREAKLAEAAEAERGAVKPSGETARRPTEAEVEEQRRRALEQDRAAATAVDGGTLEARVTLLLNHRPRTLGQLVAALAPAYSGTAVELLPLVNHTLGKLDRNGELVRCGEAGAGTTYGLRDSVAAWTGTAA